MMKRKHVHAGLAVLIVTSLVGSTALADVDIEVSATLENPITETKQTDMAFGTIGVSPTGTGGPDEVITLEATSGTPVFNNLHGSAVDTLGTATVGNIEIASTATFQVDISYSASATLSDGSNTLTLDNITTNSTVSGYTHDGSVGTSNIYVGGDLTIPWDYVAGTYSTTNAGGSAITVTITYQ